MRKADILLIFVAVLCCLSPLLAPATSGSKSLIVYQNGRVVKQLLLSDSLNTVVELPHNEITIENGCVRMSYADCPDHDCMKSGVITKNGQIIACLPNKVSLRIVSTNMDVDDVAK